MTCALALETLLDAEPSEFIQAAASPLADHLRGCARCRRVAAQLHQDTQQLAHAMAYAPARRRTRAVGRSVLLPALALGSVVLAVMLRGRGGVAPVAPPLPVPVAALSTPTVPEAPVRSPLPNVARTRRPVAPPVRRLPQAFSPAVPVAPVRLVRAEPVPSGGAVAIAGVTVSPPAGTRAAVMHTGDPKVVVVWLY